MISRFANDAIVRIQIVRILFLTYVCANRGAPLLIALKNSYFLGLFAFCGIYRLRFVLYGTIDILCELYRLLNGLPLWEMDWIINPVCALCRDHERSGFIHGVQVGMRLAQEEKSTE